MSVFFFFFFFVGFSLKSLLYFLEEFEIDLGKYFFRGFKRVTIEGDEHKCPNLLNLLLYKRSLGRLIWQERRLWKEKWNETLLHLGGIFYHFLFIWKENFN